MKTPQANGERHDLSRPDETTEDLRASEIHYRRLFESAPVGILILDAGSQMITDANPFMAELVGCLRDEFLGKELWQIGLFKDKNESQAAFRELHDSSFLSHPDLPFETKAGERREIQLIGRLYTAGTSEVVQCHIFDITERKIAEALKDRQAQDVALLAHIAGKVAGLGGWTIELPERQLAWSDENCIIHDLPPGYSPTLEEGINYFPPEYRAEVRRYVDVCAQDGTPYDFELPKYTAKGRLIWVRSVGEAVRDAEGKIIRVQGAFQDITPRKQVEAEKEKLIKELRAALAEVKTLREFLPICSYCRKVRDDQNYWSQIDNYISRHTSTKFSHGICPACYEREVAPQLAEIKKRT